MPRSKIAERVSVRFVQEPRASGLTPNATQFAEPDISRHALACGSLGKTDEPRAIALRLIRDLWQSEWHWAEAGREEGRKLRENAGAARAPGSLRSN